MKKLAIALICLAPSLAFASDAGKAYGGVKLSNRSMGFKSGFGNHLFAKDLVQYGIFGGYNFNCWLGAELGFYTTNNKNKNVTIPFGQTELGVANFSGLGADSYQTKTQLYGSNLQLVARYSLVKHLNIFGSAGIAVNKLKVEANMLTNDGAAATPLEQTNNRISQDTTKLIPVVGAGLDWRFYKNFGARAEIAWEQTQNMKMTFQTIAGAPNNYQVKPKDSIIYGLTLYFSA